MFNFFKKILNNLTLYNFYKEPLDSFDAGTLRFIEKLPAGFYWFEPVANVELLSGYTTYKEPTIVELVDEPYCGTIKRIVRTFDGEFTWDAFKKSVRWTTSLHRVIYPQSCWQIRSMQRFDRDARVAEYEEERFTKYLP